MDKKIGFSWLTQNPVGLQTKETIYLTPDAKKRLRQKNIEWKIKYLKSIKKKKKWEADYITVMKKIPRKRNWEWNESNEDGTRQRRGQNKREGRVDARASIEDPRESEGKRGKARKS